MSQEKIAHYFNEMAGRWDRLNEHDPDKIRFILDAAQVKENSIVLDVACGTGILLPFLLEKQVKRIDGIDIAESMIALARAKQKEMENLIGNTFISYQVADAYQYQPPVDLQYHTIVIYSAFPHFEKRKELIAHLAGLLSARGKLVIAHSEAKEKINRRHMGMAAGLSWGLPTAEELYQTYFAGWRCCRRIDNEDMYLLVVEKKNTY